MERPERRLILRWALAIGRLPSELLASITSADIVEMMAFSNIEPWGSLQDDFRAGQICATVANVNRDPDKRSEPWTASDFMPSLARAMNGLEKPDEPTLLDDPEAQTALIKQAIFGVSP